MTHGSHPPLATLLAWNDGEVNGRAGAAITEHINGCATCRASLNEAMSLHTLLRGLPQLTIAPDDPGLARARALAYELPRRRQRPQWQPVLLVAVMLIGVVLLTVAVRPTPSDAGMGISAIVRRLPRHNPERASDAAGVPGLAVPTVSGTVTAVSELDSGVIAPESLPLGLQRVTIESLGTGALVTYASATGLQVQIAQERADGPLHLSVTQTTQVLVRNTPVLLALDAPDRVSLAVWDVADTRFQLLTIAEPAGGLTGAMSTEIISALLNTDTTP